jgi:hypothetical protein
MMRIGGTWLWTFLAFAGFVVPGCDSAEAPVVPSTEHAKNHALHEHGHDEHAHGHEHGNHKHESAEEGEALPESYAAGVERLAELNEKIRAAFAKDDKDQADGPVHEFGHALEAIEPLAEKAGFSEEDRAAIKSAVDQLFDDVGKVDEQIHSGNGATYAEVEQQVGEALATLQKFVPTDK